MKKHPTLFMPAMVKALLAGTKPKTRRPMKPSEVEDITFLGGSMDADATIKTICQAWHNNEYRIWSDDYPEEGSLPFAAHQPGDLMWVKEAHYLCGLWTSDGKTKTGKEKRRFVAYQKMGARFEPPVKVMTGKSGDGWFKRGSLFMPEWASRIKLTVTGFRIEQLHDITEEDAKAEGIICQNVIVGASAAGGRHTEHHANRYFYPDCDDEGYETAVDAYMALWDVINGAGSADKNPWVRVISFERTPA